MTTVPASTAATTHVSEAAAARFDERLRRAAPWLGLAAFLVVFVASATVWGLPWSRDRLALWVLGALLAVSITDVRGWLRGVVLDWAPLFGVLFVYDLLRGYADQLSAGAYVTPQIRFDETLFGGAAPTVWLQQRLYDPTVPPRWWDYAAWTTYTSHFFATIVIAAVLWKVARPQFRRFAAMFISLTMLGFATYALVPAVPPWMASQMGYLPATTRIVPQMWNYVGVAPAQMLFEGGNRYANDVAALPSLHAAYPVLLLLFFWSTPRTTVGRWVVRGGIALYALAMAFALVYGAEHYVADIVLGWLDAAVVYVAMSAVLARRGQRAARAPGAAVS